MLKRAESHRCEVNKLGKLACNFNTFFTVNQTEFLENCRQILNGVTDFNQEKF